MIQIDESPVYFMKRVVSAVQDSGAAESWVDDVDISGVAEKVSSDAAKKSMDSLADFISKCVDGIRKQSPAPSSITMEAGLELLSGGQVLIVHGEVKAHLTMTLTWEK